MTAAAAISNANRVEILFTGRVRVVGSGTAVQRQMV